MYQNTRIRRFAKPQGRFTGKNSFGKPGGGRGGNRGAGRRPNFFDPTDLIRQSKIQAPVEETVYEPKTSFPTLPIDETLKRNIVDRGYTTPTPIQDQAIPLILEGKDVIGLANTGTGKTAAFLVPLLNTIAKNRQKKVLIVAPTRELAFQIKDEFLGFSRGMHIYCALLIGGENIFRQQKDLQRKPHIVIGTPGRMRDLITQRSLNLGEFEIVVLDEVDQMVDIGFIDDIKYFISLMAKERQSLFFSATMNMQEKLLLNGFAPNAITISVKKRSVLQNIKQEVIRVQYSANKIEQLVDILKKPETEKVLIFLRTKFSAQRLGQELVKRGFNADSIHGDKRQVQRSRIMDNFKKNRINILLATDVASRGLDIDNVTHVINYDPAESQETYIHRIGRTGRADKVGTAITFMS